MEQYLKNFKKCLQKEIPYCAAECPFHLNILDFIEKMKRGGFRGAFKIYRDAVGFPLIASGLCHEPCKGVCPRKETDGAVELLKLERACISYTSDKAPTDYNLPMKKKKVAVIGAGISGIACALRLCMKKYEVEIFEATGRIGGYLWELLDPELFQAEIEAQFKYENYKINFYTPVHRPEDLKDRGFDAVFAATGEGGEAFGLLSASGHINGVTGDNRHCAVYHGSGWFAGGGLIGEKPVYALANGLNMGTVIDNYLKTGILSNPENIQKTCMQLDPAKLEPIDGIRPEDETGFREEEAKQEAARCLECQCDFCRSYCDLTDFYSKWPLRIRDEIMATTLPGSADVKATPAKRLLSTCNQCGLCKEVCPEEIDLGGLILEGRKSMHRQKKAPWVFHDFWLRDMEFANSEGASLIKPSSTSAANGTAMTTKTAANRSYAFFPGCQLGASDPELVFRAYHYLRGRRPDTGLMLRCCGAPAEWSGDEEKFAREIDAIQTGWNELGKPVLILACPTCEKKFKIYMAEIPVVSLYEIIAQWGIDPTAAAATTEVSENKAGGRTYSVFDACAARHEPGMKEAVRTLAKASGCHLEPMEKHDAYEQCCGFGGQPGAANPEYAAFVAQKRIAEGDAPYITYCINCRDIFLEAGKEAVHILDLLFGNTEAPKLLPSISQRRENRIELKNILLREFWREDIADNWAGPSTANERKTKAKVMISKELSQKLSRQRILEEDIAEVMEFCERTGRKTYHPERGTYSGYRKIGHMTYWAEYKKVEPVAGVKAEAADRSRTGTDACELVNAYAHRMKIELEAVWNGKRTDPDQ